MHLFAVFGFFLAVAYPIWLLTLPEKTSCFWCRTRKNGEWCPLCRRTVDKSDLRPSSFQAVFFNVILVLVISGISLGLVFAESKVLKVLGFPPTPKTVSFVIPPKGQYRLGEIFPMKIDIAGIKTPINAVQADIAFDPRILEVREISTKDSFANIFIQKEINNEVGYARLNGGLPNPGFSSDHGIFGIVYFQGKNPGVVKVEFLPTSLVLANDGRGRNVLKDLASASYLILPEELSPEERAEQEVILQPVVLGETSEKGTQMTFYEENRILGEELNKDIKQPAETREPFNLKESFLTLLGKLDDLIIKFWKPVFGGK